MTGKKRVLITGATSFIGNAMIRRLLNDSNYDIIAVVRPNSTRLKSIPKVERVRIIESELENVDQIEEKNLGKVDIIYHVGWSSDFVNPRYNLEGQLQNVTYLEKTIVLACKCGCEKLVCVGSQAECGRVDERISELTPSHPETAYAIAKCRAYEFGMELCGKYGIGLFWPRLLSAYGPNDKCRTMIMSCLDAAVNRKRIEFTGCEQIWDYIYVDDVADALILIGEKGMRGIKYSIASGQGRTLREYIEDIAKFTGNSEILDGLGKKPYAENQVMYLVGDIQRLTKDTGFVPRVSFEQGIENTINANYKL